MNNGEATKKKDSENLLLHYSLMGLRCHIEDYKRTGERASLNAAYSTLNALIEEVDPHGQAE